MRPGSPNWSVLMEFIEQCLGRGVLVLMTWPSFLDGPVPDQGGGHRHRQRRLRRLRGDLVDDDMIVVTSVGYPNVGNRMNLIETHLVSDLKRGIGWSD